MLLGLGSSKQLGENIFPKCLEPPSRPRPLPTHEDPWAVAHRHGPAETSEERVGVQYRGVDGGFLKLGVPHWGSP